jgi:phosphoadenosine phosphosulfate reductase
MCVKRSASHWTAKRNARCSNGLTRGVELQQVAEQAGRDLETATAQEVVRWAVDTFGDKFAIASSMGDGLLAHLAASVSPGVDILFLDTGYHFAETIGTRDAVASSYDVNVRTILPLLTVAQQDAEHGSELWNRDPTSCCAMRKVEPLARALEPYVAWASGVRRDEAVTRRETGVVEWDDKRGKVKVNPIATWTQAEVDAYVEKHGVLVNPLAYDGYPSIGCAPCTHRVAPGEDPRSGRWSGQAKTECGIHV